MFELATSKNWLNGLFHLAAKISKLPAAATGFFDTLNHAHSAVSFTMEVKKDGMLPFLGVQLLNRAPCVETKVYVKPTNTGLPLHYHNHVDNRYKHGLLVTIAPTGYRHLRRISQKSVNA